MNGVKNNWLPFNSECAEGRAAVTITQGFHVCIAVT